MVVFLNCSNNNKAATVFNSFHQAIQDFGLPSRVRTDKGMENVDVAWFMLNHPKLGPNRGSHITGRSVHNQRIERLWRDVFAGCTHVYYQLFYEMEETGILDADNEAHIYALHFVFTPRINRSLKIFAEGFNNTPISTEHRLSPIQLWTRGILEGRTPTDYNLNVSYFIVINRAGFVQDFFPLIANFCSLTDSGCYRSLQRLVQ